VIGLAMLRFRRRFLMFSGSPRRRSIVAAIVVSRVVYADDGRVELSVSRNATIHMLTAKRTTRSRRLRTTMVSMYQTNSVAVARGALGLTGFPTAGCSAYMVVSI
jgi:hypothetical protein